MPPTRRVKPERTGRRSLWYSRRHRSWGWDAPYCDLDSLEYDNGQPVALIELKGPYDTVNLNSANIRAQKNLADRAGLPFFVVRYAKAPVSFHVIPLNDLARDFVSEPTTLSEQQYVALLYRLRGRTLPPEIAMHLEG